MVEIDIAKILHHFDSTNCIIFVKEFLSLK